MGAAVKELFVVHTRRDPLQLDLYDYLRAHAAVCKIGIVDYSDWQWKKPGETVIADLATLAERRLERNRNIYERLPASIDKSTLATLWQHSRVLVIVNPPLPGRRKEGARYELTQLPAFFAERRVGHPPIPVVLNLAHDRQFTLRGIPVACTLSMLDPSDEATRQNAFGMIALAWFVRGVEGHGLLGRYLLSAAPALDPLALQLIELSKGRLRRGTDDVNRVDLHHADPVQWQRFRVFWGRANAVRAYIEQYRERCAFLAAAHSLIGVVEARLNDYPRPPKLDAAGR